MAKPLEKQNLTGSVSGDVRHVTVTEDDAGVRLDKFLARQFPEVPRSRLYRIVRRGEVRLNGHRVQIDQRLQIGDAVRLPPVRPERPAALETGAGESVAGGAVVRGSRAAAARVPRTLVQTITAAIVQEDERLIVVNKPAGIAVHGGSGISFGVIEALRAARPDEADSLELVHRLDRDTSGVLLVARKSSVLRMLHAQLREGHEFEKRYLALLKGSWQLGQKRIDAPLRTDLRVGGERTVRVQAGGKASISDFRPVQFFGARATLLEVAILTGRTHQIRVHAAYAGHPVAGDDKYGDREFNAELARLGLKRMFLHASSISFTWPDRGTDFSVNAPLPPELGAVIDALTTRTPTRRRSLRRR
ncbi:MAG: RluA family pseudouridine synthase [Steroidobacteraceae bacterium]|nr:RluA family pseudouridine synthase [Nevskiaceae bacterium]